MRLYEFEAKRLLREFGVPVPEGLLLREGAAVDAPPPVVLKSQVLTGGRLKGGGVRFAATREEAAAALAALWKHPVGGMSPRAILVEPRFQVAEEFYLAVTYDQQARLPVLVFSRQGGIEVEDQVRGGASVGRVLLSSFTPPPEYRVREALVQAGVRSPDLPALGRIAGTLARAFFAGDLLLAEINPLARLADGSFLALDAHCEVDDDALGRQRARLQALGISDLMRPHRAPTPFEMAAQAVDGRDHRGVAGRVVEFEGPLGLLIGGGGASLSAFDAVRRQGGRPANYCEIGGNPSVAKVADLARLILSKPGVRKLAVIMNVVSNTRVDLVARGVIKGILLAGREPAETLAVFRVPGAWEAEGAAVLRRYGIEPRDRRTSIDEAAAQAVAACEGEVPV